MKADVVEPWCSCGKCRFEFSLRSFMIPFLVQYLLLIHFCHSTTGILFNKRGIPKHTPENVTEMCIFTIQIIQKIRQYMGCYL